MIETDRFDALLAILKPVDGKRNEYHCPNCGSENLKVDTRRRLWYAWGCGCSYQDVMSAAFPELNYRQKTRTQSFSSAKRHREIDFWSKPPRPKQRREWVYPDLAGQPVIKVIRADDGSGNKRIWQESLVSGKQPGDLQPLVAPYRYQDCLKVIDGGEPVLWVEGEATADALWDIGIAATTTIRGSDGYSSQYKGLFPSESLVICPDRDKPGMKYAQAIAADYPDARWLYAEPDSPEWEDLPEKGGYDLQDWIESGTVKSGILGAVGNRRSQKPSCPTEDAAKIEKLISILEAQRDDLSDQLLAGIQKLSESDYLSRDQLKNEVSIIKLKLSKTKNQILSLQQKNSKIKKQIRESKLKQSDDRTPYCKDRDTVEDLLTGRVRYNLLTRMVELDGRVLSFSEPRAELSRITGFANWHTGDQSVMELVINLAKQDSYHPVHKYLTEDISYISDADPSFLDNLAERYYGVSDPLQNLYLKITLIGAVKRILTEGESIHRYLLILLGRQRRGKSTSLKKLFGSDFFGDGQITMGDPDSVLKINQAWGYEVPEIDLLFSTRHESSLKSFISLTTDVIRRPYGRNHETTIRRTILFGTTNKKDILVDETGSSRYLIIHIPDYWQIPLDLIEAERDKVWASALLAFYYDMPNDLPEEDFERTEARNLEYREIDDWEAVVVTYASRNPGCTALEILTEACKMELGRITKRDSHRVGKILKFAGYENVARNSKREWYKKGDDRLR